MPTNVRDFTSAGFDMAQVAGLINSVIPGGLEGSVASDTTEYVQRFYGVKTANMQLPEANRVPVTGDDKLLSVFLFVSQDPVTFTLEVGQSYLDLVQEIQGTEIYTLGTYYDISVLSPGIVEFNDMLLVFTAQAKSKKSGSPGSGYHNLVLPLCNMTYRGRGLGEQEAATFSYDVVANPTDKFPWNQTVTEDNVGTTSIVAFEFWTENRIAFATHNPAGASGSFVLERTPTAANRVLVWDTSTGGLTSPTVTPATKTVSFTGATAGQYLLVMQEYA